MAIETCAVGECLCIDGYALDVVSQTHKMTGTPESQQDNLSLWGCEDLLEELSALHDIDCVAATLEQTLADPSFKEICRRHLWLPEFIHLARKRNDSANIKSDDSPTRQDPMPDTLSLAAFAALKVDMSAQTLFTSKLGRLALRPAISQSGDVVVYFSEHVCRSCSGLLTAFGGWLEIATCMTLIGALISMR